MKTYTKVRNYTKVEALRIVLSCAKDYNKFIANHNYLFLYKNRENNQIEYFESIFLPRNFTHLTGLSPVGMTSDDFYKKAIKNKLTVNDFEFKDNTTNLKLHVLSILISHFKSSKMTGDYNESHSVLKVDKLIGTTNFSLGFKKDRSGYYVPASAMFDDVRNLVHTANQILAIYEKEKKAAKYSMIKYVAKGVKAENLSIPEDLIFKLDIK